MLGNELPDELHFRCRDEPPPIAKISFHAWQRSRDEIRTQAPPATFFNSPRSAAATPAPPGSPSGHPPPTTLAVDAPPDSAPPRPDSGLLATREIALLTAASARAKILGRRTPKCESPFPVGCEKRTASRKKDRLEASPDTTAPASRCLYGHPPLPLPPGWASAA